LNNYYKANTYLFLRISEAVNINIKQVPLNAELLRSLCYKALQGEKENCLLYIALELPISQKILDSKLNAAIIPQAFTNQNRVNRSIIIGISPIFYLKNGDFFS